MTGLVRRDGPTAIHATGEQAAAIVAGESHALTGDQIELLKRTICKGATNDELALFVQTSKRMGLDPFARQIFAVKRNSKVDGQWVSTMTIQTSIDGYRLIADRTGKYEGQLGPFWCGDDGVWVDVWLAHEAPRAARVGVLKAGFREPLWSVALWHSYAQTKSGGGLNRMWGSMGPLMIGKCAEALALRRAFPAELSGVYTTDEMGQASNGEPSRKSAPSAPALPPTRTVAAEGYTAPTPPESYEAEPLPAHTSQRVEVADLLAELKRKRSIGGVDAWVSDNGDALEALNGDERKQVIAAYREKRATFKPASAPAAPPISDDAAERAALEAEANDAERFFNDQANAPDPMEGF